MEVLQSLMDMPKQGHANAISKGETVVITDIKLNKACTVAHVWWNLSLLDPNINGNKTLMDIQRNLTKAKGYLAGLLTKRLNLRYAPDLRFYIDKSEEEYEDLMKRLEEKLSHTSKTNKLKDEIKLIRSLSPSHIQKLREALKTEEEKAEFDKITSRKTLEVKEEMAGKMKDVHKKIEEELAKLPKIKKIKQKKLDEIQKGEEQMYRDAGYDPEKIMNPTIDDLENIGDEFRASYRHEIPVKNRKNLYDNNGKRIRKHPRDKNGKKIRTKSKKSRAEKFWASLGKDD